MIYVVTHPRRKGILGKVPSCCETCRMRKNYTVAACDRCRAECAESRQPNSRGDRASNAAVARALELGWVQEQVYKPRKGRRKAGVILQLVCPACQAPRDPSDE